MHILLTNLFSFVQALKSFTHVRHKIAAAMVIENDNTKSPVVSDRPTKLSQCPFHLSITSLEKQDTRSIDTVMTWLDDTNTSQETTDNLVNEKLEEHDFKACVWPQRESARLMCDKFLKTCSLLHVKVVDSWGLSNIAIFIDVCLDYHRNEDRYKSVAVATQNGFSLELFPLCIKRI